MARFYGTVQGDRGMASRLGRGASGVKATASGWNIGGEVVAEDTWSPAGSDRVNMTITGGSKGSLLAGLIAQREGDGNSSVVITQVDANLLSMITDDAWREVFKHEDVAARLRTLLFFDGKAAP